MHIFLLDLEFSLFSLLVIKATESVFLRVSFVVQSCLASLFVESSFKMLVESSCQLPRVIPKPVNIKFETKQLLNESRTRYKRTSHTYKIYKVTCIHQEYKYSSVICKCEALKKYFDF